MRRFLNILLAVSFLAAAAVPASASTSLTFSVKPSFPTNQISGTKGYYHLHAAEGETYSLSFVISNTSDSRQTIFITPVNGLTSPSGGTQYVSKTETPNSWLLEESYAAAPLTDIQKSVDLKPNESKEIRFTVKMPRQLSSGTLLGGLHFTTNETSSSKKENSKDSDVSFVIKNQVAYVLGLQLDFPEKEEVNFSFGQPELGLIPSAPLLLLPMTNANATITENIKGNYQILDSAQNVVFEGTFGSFKMAPKTKINYPIHWNSDFFKPGTYTFKLDGSVSGKPFKHTASFKIKNEKVKEYQELSGVKKPIADYFPWYSWIVFGFLCAGLLYLGIYLGKRKKS